MATLILSTQSLEFRHRCIGLRAVAHALLRGTNDSTIKLGEGPYAGAEAVASLSYLRDRVGVPRDLPLPAARQLRAHLNWAIDSLRSPEDQ